MNQPTTTVNETTGPSLLPLDSLIRWAVNQGVAVAFGGYILVRLEAKLDALTAAIVANATYTQQVLHSLDKLTK